MILLKHILKACSIDQKNIEALLLHGMILTSMKKYSDAILQFRKANDVRNLILMSYYFFMLSNILFYLIVSALSF
jgi:hypothetical protein